ncbi:hypothetical protein [Vibrio phage LP.2]|nr:hypothetical protein [Vibrio phage LP.2]
MSNVDKFFEGYEEGDHLYVPPSIPEDEDEECKYVLSGKSGISPEILLAELEPIAQAYGIVWCNGTNTYKVRKTVRLIDEIGEK